MPGKRVMNPLHAHPLVASLRDLFEHLPDVFFFIKDSRSRFLHANEPLLERLGLSSLESIVGTTDHDRYPPEIADRLVEGDQEMMRTSLPAINKLEVLYNDIGTLEWFSTTKYPVIGDDGDPLGVVGFARSFSSPAQGKFHFNAAAQMIDYLSRHPDSLLSIEQLAARFGISGRQLHRQFREILQISPQEFLLRNRIHAAAIELRKSDITIIELATKYGFCDQSAFTKRFKKTLGATPANYRRKIT